MCVYIYVQLALRIRGGVSYIGVVTCERVECAVFGGSSVRCQRLSLFVLVRVSWGMIVGDDRGEE